jgi:hypothetical protein
MEENANDFVNFVSVWVKPIGKTTRNPVEIFRNIIF